MFNCPYHLASFFQMLVKFRWKTLTLLLEAVFDNLMYGLSELQKLKSILPRSVARMSEEIVAGDNSPVNERLRFAQFADDADDIFYKERTGTDG